MTSAQDVIESYVADVGGRLPLGKRADIARELQSLLNDELQARADGAGRPADEAMARAVVTAFGSADEVAARYRSGGLLIIPPEQSARFLSAAVGGVVIQWAIGIAAAIARISDGAPESVVAQQWFFSWGLGAFWWPGFMVFSAAIAAWLKTRKPGTAIQGDTNMNSRSFNRIGAGAALPVALFFTAFYAAPNWFLAHLAPSIDTSWITYTDAFRNERLWALLLYMTGNVGLLALFAVKGHESRVTRQFAIGMGLAGVAVLTWCAFAGPIVVSAQSDQVFRALLVVMALIALTDLWRRVSREMILAR